MSFILDALRKSDAERQRAVTPGLSDVRYAARRSRRNIWLPILVVVLAANVVFMGVQWFGRAGSAPAVPPPGAAPAGVPAANPVQAPVDVPGAAATPEAPLTDIRPLAREAEFAEPDLESEFAAPPGPITARPGSAPVPAPVVLEATEAPGPGGSAAVQPPVTAAPPPAGSSAPPATPSRILASNDLPPAEQLMGAGSLNIPMLNLDLHVYSEKPAGRFVVINSHKYKEGGPLSEGPTVEAITKDGVILVYQGRRFTLSRK